MGMFDKIWITCKCGEKIEAQSKSGECSFADYEPESVPVNVAVDANRHAPFQCEKCGKLYKFDIPKAEDRIVLRVIEI